MKNEDLNRFYRTNQRNHPLDFVRRNKDGKVDDGGEPEAPIPGTFRFGQSSVSSTFDGTTELQKSDLIDATAEPTVGSVAIFPDDKSLVLFIGTITAVNGDSYTVGELGYLKDTWQHSGKWQKGTSASYPETYEHNGSLWLCLASDVTEDPVEGKNWQLLAQGTTVRPTFLRVSGDPISDTDSDEYLIALTNLSPTNIKPEVDDIVIFSTTGKFCVGTVKEVQEAGINVTVKQSVKIATE